MMLVPDVSPISIIASLSVPILIVIVVIALVVLAFKRK